MDDAQTYEYDELSYYVVRFVTRFHAKPHLKVRSFKIVDILSGDLCIHKIDYVDQ
jgi:hypothetical protein